MPSFEEHRRKAESNIGFVSHLYENRLYNDWAVTGCFYAAVHIAEAALFKEERVSYRTGRDRKSQVVITPGNGQKKIEHSSDISGVIPNDPFSAFPARDAETADRIERVLRGQIRGLLQEPGRNVAFVQIPVLRREQEHGRVGCRKPGRNNRRFEQPRRDGVSRDKAGGKMKPMRIFPLSASVRRKNGYIKNTPGLTRYCRSCTGSSRGSGSQGFCSIFCLKNGAFKGSPETKYD